MRPLELIVGLAVLLPVLLVGLVANSWALFRYVPKWKQEKDNFVWKILVTISGEIAK